MRLSARVQQIQESATLQVSRRAAELKAAGVEVLDLSAGEPDFRSPACAVAAAKRALDDGLTRYTATAGLPMLRRALADSYQRRYGAPWEPGDVVVTVGAKAALLELLLTLCDGGGEVVLPSPFWVSLPEQVRLAGGRPVAVPVDPADGFRLRAEPILAAVTDATRGILLNSPCNPTGGVLGADDLRAIVTAAAERGLWVICDETYERFVYGGARHASGAELAAEFPNTVVVVGSFSKTYSMTGWRLGWALGPRVILDGVARIQSHATSNPTSFAMVGAIAALQSADGEVEAMLREFGERRDLVVEGLKRLAGVECAPPAGAFYVFPRVAERYGPGRDGSVAFAEWLLDEARVAVVPGEAFGDDRHVRLSFACSRDTLERALGRLADLLA